MRLPVTPTGHSSRPPSWTCFSPAHACASRDCPMLCLLQPMMLAGRPRHAWRSPRAPGGRLQRKMSRKGELRKAKRRHTWATPISLTRRAYYYVSCGFQRGGRQHGSPSSPLSAPSRLRLRAAQALYAHPCNHLQSSAPRLSSPVAPGKATRLAALAAAGPSALHAPRAAALCHITARRAQRGTTCPACSAHSSMSKTSASTSPTSSSSPSTLPGKKSMGSTADASRPARCGGALPPSPARASVALSHALVDAVGRLLRRGGG
jgi:hypothetical protein